MKEESTQSSGANQTDVEVVPKKKDIDYKNLTNEDFNKAFIDYYSVRNKKVRGNIAKTGKSIFKYHKIQFHHISVKDNGVDYLIHDGIVICSFPAKKDRNDIYAFLDKHWDERIEPFCKYIKERRDREREASDPFE